MAAKKTVVNAPKAPGKPVRVNPETAKLTPLQVDILGYVHGTGRQHTAEEIKAATGATASENALTGTLNKLVEGQWLQVSDKGKFSLLGSRVKALQLAVDNLRVNGGPMTPGDLGAAIWADPKTAAKDPKAKTRYFAAASALCANAFHLGVLYRMQQDGVTRSYGLYV